MPYNDFVFLLYFTFSSVRSINKVKACPFCKLLRLQGTLGILEEQMHIKDALSRIVVEIAKREWPQQWSSMIDELDAICSCGVRISVTVLMHFNSFRDVALCDFIHTSLS